MKANVITPENCIRELQRLSKADKREMFDPKRQPFSGKNLRTTREIGKHLYRIGGEALMRQAFDYIPKMDRRELEMCWDGIGGWKS